MNIYLHEIKMGMKEFLIWTICIIIIVLGFMLMFPAIAKEADKMNAVISKFPAVLVKALGLGKFNFAEVLGFFGFIQNYVMLAAAIYGMKLGYAVISKEEREYTADFLVSKPVTRNTIVGAKGLSAITFVLSQYVIFTWASTLIISFITSKTYDFGTLVVLNASLLLVQFFFLTFGMMVSVFMKRVKTVLPTSMGIVFVFYIIEFLHQSFPDSGLGYITPFAYFNAADILTKGALNSNYLILSLLLSGIFILITHFVFDRKNIASV